MEMIWMQNIPDIISLINVTYDIRARDGTWCCLPYAKHPKGCPQFPKCPASFNDFKEIQDLYFWYAVIECFDLEGYMLKRKEMRPNDSERQLKNLLYWQSGVKARLLKKTKSFAGEKDIILKIPEAYGINIFRTMENVGVFLEVHPRIVKKIMLLGKFKN